MQNFTCAKPNTCLGRAKLLSLTVDSDGRTLHVSHLIHGENKNHPYCFKYRNKLKKVKFTKPGNSCFDFSVICVLLSVLKCITISLWK